MNPLNKIMTPGRKWLVVILSIFFMHAVYAQENGEQLFKKGMERQQHGEYEQAVQCYDKALAADSLMVKAYLQRGFCKVALKDYQGAIGDYTKLLSCDPKHTWAWISRGSARNKLGDFQSAISDFNKALELDPQNQEAYNNRGFSKKGMGDEQGACEDWRQSRKMGNEEAKIILKNNHCK